MDWLKGIKNIIFDLGAVIIDIEPGAAIQAFIKMGVDIEKLFAGAGPHEIFNQLETGKLRPDEFRNRLRSITNIDFSDHDIDTAWNSMLIGIPMERLELLELLKHEYRTFLLSNTNAIHMESIDKHLVEDHKVENLEPFFERSYYSYKEGMRKPEPAIFEKIISDNGLLLSETLFIDDSKEHIDCAESLGIRTRHLLNGEEIVQLFSTFLQ